MVEEPGLDLHEWETRWQEFQEAAADDPEGALPDLVRLIEQMLVERGFQLDEPVTMEGEDADIVRNYLAARDVSAVAQEGTADPEDVIVALESLGEIHDYLVSDRKPP
jgi:hypothetical protein